MSRLRLREIRSWLERLATVDWLTPPESTVDRRRKIVDSCTTTRRCEVISIGGNSSFLLKLFSAFLLFLRCRCCLPVRCDVKAV